MSLTLKEILELIDKVASSGISLLELERSGTRLRIEGKKPDVVSMPVYAPQTETAPAFAPQPAAAPAAAPPLSTPESDEEINKSWHIITSPIVGTFYRSPNPESEAFVGVGDRVGKGQVLCIIEAMKLMNEIECDIDGVVAKIYPQNGQPVEYGEKLFAVQV
jgi:acetyl-CoA carboxylase biotin carboxyl carrier protein